MMPPFRREANTGLPFHNEAFGAYVAHLQRGTNFLENIANAAVNLLIVPAENRLTARRRVILFFFP